MCMNSKSIRVILDTNAFYDFCHVFGLEDFGIPTGINQRVDYDTFKKEMEAALLDKSLFIPATTIFEFVCKLRNNDKGLKKVIDFLKEVSNKYSYDLFAYNKYDNYGILFGFDQFSDEYWEEIHSNYEKLIEYKDTIMLAKIGSEAEILTIFSRSIIHLFIIDYFYGKAGYDTLIDKFNRYLFVDPFGDGQYRAIKYPIARELYEHYKHNKEGKNKKAIFESAIKLSAYFLKDFWDYVSKISIKKKEETIRTLEVDFSSEKSIQVNIYKWFNIDKNKENLSKNIEYVINSLRDRCDFNNFQFAYLENSFVNLFTHGAKREKNDAEDYWNLGFVEKDSTYLVSFELEIIDILKQKCHDNYDYICKFYNPC